jgi:hypothetical protein
MAMTLFAFVGYLFRRSMEFRKDVPLLKMNVFLSRSLLALGLSALCVHSAPLANYNSPLDRNYTLKNRRPDLLESEYRRIVASSASWSSIFPRSCLSMVDSSQVCEEPGRLGFQAPTQNQGMDLVPIIGYEFRDLGETAHSGEFGAITSGYHGPISFFLDARMYAESHEKFDHPSYDREGLDRQDEQASGSVAYSSFARYRTNLSYDWTWGRATAGRDAAHWGPGLLSNLSFHQDAVPFNQFTFTTRLGPLNIQSLYGQLIIGADWESNTSTDSRHLYAHRYEWQAARNLLLGVSEQLVLSNQAAPFAFVPLVPLFIAKYSEKERLNNGNMAFDVSYRFPEIANVYSEFLLDDIQSPGSFFGDYWGNKWGWMAGIHWIRDFPAAKLGVVLEYARLEPWVYTHYLAGTAQTLHFDAPLGNQDGPNSQSIKARAYSHFSKGVHLSLDGKALWKGQNPGSSVLDLHADTDPSTKEFLGKDAEFSFTITPSLSYRFANARCYLESGFGTDYKTVLGAQIWY